MQVRLVLRWKEIVEEITGIIFCASNNKDEVVSRALGNHGILYGDNSADKNEITLVITSSSPLKQMLRKVLRLCSSLQFFYLNGCCDLCSIESNVSKVKLLDLSKSCVVEDLLYGIAARKSLNLTHIDLSYCIGVKNSTLICRAEMCRHDLKS